MKRFVALRIRSPDACYSHPQLSIRACRFDLAPFRVREQRKLAIWKARPEARAAWDFDADFMEGAVLVTYGQSTDQLHAELRRYGLGLAVDQVVVDAQEFFHLDPSLTKAALKAGFKAPRSEAEAARATARLFSKHWNPIVEFKLDSHPAHRSSWPADYGDVFVRDAQNQVRLTKGEYAGWTVVDAYLEGYEFQDLTHDARTLAMILAEAPKAPWPPRPAAPLYRRLDAFDKWFTDAEAWLTTAQGKHDQVPILRDQLLRLRRDLEGI
ncbi:MAG: hypothetical protein QOD77_349 [Thermoplasmata archaeon]|jgi:hypothetical protein|nr:hypothetical protein [Thermoplasmata archaeon]